MKLHDIKDKILGFVEVLFLSSGSSMFKELTGGELAEIPGKIGSPERFQLANFSQCRMMDSRASN